MPRPKSLPDEAVLESALTLMREHGRWSMLGRLAALPSSVAADQGYRRGVAEALRSAEAWCDYLGDALGRVQARLALGRLMGYEMAGGVPRLAIEPDRILRLASEEAETLLVTAAEERRRFAFELVRGRVKADLRLEPVDERRSAARLEVEVPWLAGSPRTLAADALSRLHDLCQTAADR